MMERHPALARYLEPAIRDWGHVDVLNEILATMLLIQEKDARDGRDGDPNLSKAIHLLADAVRALES